MSSITTRSVKGSELTHSEVDQNFTNLNTDKLENVADDSTPQLAGDLDAQSNKITGLADPTSAQDAATKSYVDTASSSGLQDVVDDTTPQLGGDLDVQTNKITSSGTQVSIAGTDDIDVIINGSTSNDAAFFNQPDFKASADTGTGTNFVKQNAYIHGVSALNINNTIRPDDTTNSQAGYWDVFTNDGSNTNVAIRISNDPDIRFFNEYSFPTTDGTNGQVLTTDGAGQLSFTAGGGLSLTDLSVGTEATASGDGAISYDNTTGVFTYTPPTLAGLGGIDLTDISVGANAAVQEGDGGNLSYNNTTGVFTFRPADVYVDADVDTHLNTSSATANQLLRWTGSDYQWFTSTKLDAVEDDTSPVLGGDLQLDDSSSSDTHRTITDKNSNTFVSLEHNRDATATTRALEFRTGHRNDGSSGSYRQAVLKSVDVGNQSYRSDLRLDAGGTGYIIVSGGETYTSGVGNEDWSTNGWSYRLPNTTPTANQTLVAGTSGSYSELEWGNPFGDLSVTDNVLSVDTTDDNLELKANGNGVALLAHDSDTSILPSNNPKNFLHYSHQSASFGTRRYANGCYLDVKIDSAEADSSSSDDRWRNMFEVKLDLNGKDSTSTSSYVSKGPQNAQFCTVLNSGSTGSTLGNANAGQNGLFFNTTSTGDLTITECAAHSSSIESSVANGTTLTVDNAYGYSSRGVGEGGAGINDFDRFCHFHAYGRGRSYELAFVAETNAGQSRLNDIFLQNVSTDPSTRADGSHIYAKDDAGSSEVYVQDEAGNVTKISPHNDAGEWEYYSVNKLTGKSVRINMEKMIRRLEEITGESFIDEE